MGQAFIEGVRIPITSIKVGPCVVTQIKKVDTDGYWAVQLGFGTKKTKNVTKPLRGHLKGAISKGKSAPRFLREIRLDNKPKYKAGDVINVSDVFKLGDLVQVTGISKGKGFAGVVKRWRFAGGPRTHGQSDRLRAPGSIGQGTTPGRVWKGKKMPGRMGSKKTAINNLMVVSVNPGENEISVSGPVPGAPGGLLGIKKLASGKLEDLVKEGPKTKVEQPILEEQAEKEQAGEKPQEEKTTEKIENKKGGNQ